MKIKDSRTDFLGWLGFKSKLAFKQHQTLGYFFGFCITLVVFAFVTGGILTIIQFMIIIFQFGDNHEAIRNVGLVVAAVIGAPFLIWRSLVAHKQAATAEQSHITDQINKAIEGLSAVTTSDRIGRSIFLSSSDPHEEDTTAIEWEGHPITGDDDISVVKRSDWQVFSHTLPNIESRVGAIYSLERIAQDSPRDHIQIMEILSAYIRENAPAKELTPTQSFVTRPTVRTDIQAAIDVIGRRTQEQIEIEWDRKLRLDLRNTDLSGADFKNGSFGGALFFDSRLEAVSFRGAKLSGARMHGCLLNYADFFEADLKGAILDHAKITALQPINGSITIAQNTVGLSMAGADFSAIGHLRNDELHSPTFGTKDTDFKPHLKHQLLERLEDIQQFDYHLSEIEIEDAAGVQGRLSESGFLYWSPYSSNDGATGMLYKNLLDHLNLKGFPYDD